MTNPLREVVADALPGIWRERAARKRQCGLSKEAELDEIHATELENALATLPSQSAGVEERARELLAAEYERSNCKNMAELVRSTPFEEFDTRHQVALDAIATALRTQQPAASEGDGRDWRLKLRDELRNTSKQAAGEAVAPDLSDDGIGRIADDVYRAMRDNGYTGAQGGVWWNKSMNAAGWNAGYRATPPRHPADEGVECAHQWVDARNQYVLSGELCLKCYAMRAGNQAALQAGTP